MRFSGQYLEKLMVGHGVCKISVWNANVSNKFLAFLGPYWRSYFDYLRTSGPFILALFIPLYILCGLNLCSFLHMVLLANIVPNFFFCCPAEQTIECCMSHSSSQQLKVASIWWPLLSQGPALLSFMVEFALNAFGSIWSWKVWKVKSKTACAQTCCLTATPVFILRPTLDYIWMMYLSPSTHS